MFSGILNFLAKFFLSPIFTGISVLVPGLTSFFSAILTFIGYGLQYVSFFTKLLMIPKSILIVFVGLSVGIFSFNLTIRTVGLAVGIYRHFKP